jgi:hypothetical protein
MKTMPQVDRRSLYLGLPVTAFWVLSYLAARFALEELQLDPWLRVTVAVLPVLPTALFLWLVVANIRSLDELQRRVHLEALAIAFPLAILLLWTLGLLQLAINLPTEDWSYRHVWAYLPLFYFIGLAIAWRRYQ